MKKKGLALVLALALLVIGVVGGTLAWLTSTSDEVVNTFTTSDITVKLKETKGTGTDTAKSFKMIPGYTIEKDPKAWVVAGSEDCFLFVKLEKSTNFDSFLTYAVANGWELVPGQTNVYYRKVAAAQMSDDNGVTNSFPVLEGNVVTVKGTVTKADMNGLTAATYPTLKVTAYASQLYKSAGVEFTAAEAWANIG